MSSSSTTLERLDQIRSRIRPALHRTMLVAIDGPAGSGKTTLARDLAVRWDASVVHMDDLYVGWDGIDAGIERLRTEVLKPLREGRPAQFRRFDWYAEALAEVITIDAPEVLIVEGCHSAQPDFADVTSLICWVEAPDELRLRRGLARDGEGARQHWAKFMHDELARYRSARTRERAHVHIDEWGKIVQEALPKQAD